MRMGSGNDCANNKEQGFKWENALSQSKKTQRHVVAEKEALDSGERYDADGDLSVPVDAQGRPADFISNKIELESDRKRKEVQTFLKLYCNVDFHSNKERTWSYRQNILSNSDQSWGLVTNVFLLLKMKYRDLPWLSTKFHIKFIKNRYACDLSDENKNVSLLFNMVFWKWI